MWVRDDADKFFNMRPGTRTSADCQKLKRGSKDVASEAKVKGGKEKALMALSST